MIKVHILLVVAVVVGFFAVVPVTPVEASHGEDCSGQTISDCRIILVNKFGDCSTADNIGECQAYVSTQQVHNEEVGTVYSDTTTETEFEDVTYKAPERSGINFPWNSPLNPEITNGGIAGLITAILDALVILLVPIITLMIIYSGFMYVTARGNAEQVKKATASLTYAIIGAILVLGAVLLSEIIEETITSIG